MGVSFMAGRRWRAVRMPSPDVGWRPRGGQRERSGAGGELRRLEVSLVAGEETRSRETRENAKMTARHLVPLRAALGAGDGMGTGCGDHDGIHGKFHGASAFAAEYTSEERVVGAAVLRSRVLLCWGNDRRTRTRADPHTLRRLSVDPLCCSLPGGPTCQRTAREGYRRLGFGERSL